MKQRTESIRQEYLFISTKIAFNQERLREMELKRDRLEEEIRRLEDKIMRQQEYLRTEKFSDGVSYPR